MPKLELLKLVQTGDFEAFDNRCLELLQAGEIKPGELVQPFEALQSAGQQERLNALTPMVYEALDWESDPTGIIALTKAALAADPDNKELRGKLAEAYTRVYGNAPGFQQLMTLSGLQVGRPFRNACKVLDFGFELQAGTCLINRMDDSAVEVVEVDRANNLFTLRRESRRTTVSAAELARAYDEVDQNDFRVLRQLRPERLKELVEQDPVALVTGLIHAHGGHIDQEMLKDELVPRHMETKAWSKWWTGARAKLKRCKHIIIEGRAPVVLSYSHEGQTFEDETREAFDAAKEPVHWLKLVDGYLREKRAHKEEPDAGLLKDLVDHMVAYMQRVRKRQPWESLATALVLRRLGERGLGITPEIADAAADMLREADEPGEVIARLRDTDLWSAALEALETAYPETHGQHAVQLMGTAPAGVLDRIAAAAVACDAANDAQKWIEKALDRPVGFPELIHWLWAGPKQCAELRIPSDSHLLDGILDTLYTLGRSLNPDPKIMKTFRLRIRSTLGLRDYAKVRACFDQLDQNQAVSVRHELMRIEGIGNNASAAMLNILRERYPELWYQPQARRLEPWEDLNVIWTTEAGLRRRQAESERIVNVEMYENAKRIGEAASHGDLSENSEYKFALEERDLLRARLATINSELSIARIVEPETVATERVEIGARVKLRDVVSGTERVMTILGPFDTDVDNGVFNYRAPACQVIMGHRVGDTIRLTMDGNDVDFEVVSIENAMLG
ncbi:MAG: GreA/GreB family elongation factor [Phycisphaerae bacterium]|nr:GreA/GreB family elongation factor [Phycisphaerae bacterium]